MSGLYLARTTQKKKKKNEIRKSSKIIHQILGICTYTHIKDCIPRSNWISSDFQRLITFEMKKYQNTISSGVWMVRLWIIFFF